MVSLRSFKRRDYYDSSYRLIIWQLKYYRPELGLAESVDDRVYDQFAQSYLSLCSYLKYPNKLVHDGIDFCGNMELHLDDPQVVIALNRYKKYKFRYK